MVPFSSMLSPAWSRGNHLGQFNVCSLIPTQYIPVLKDIVTKVGCLPSSRALAAAQIAQAASPPDTRTPEQRAAGVPAPQPPPWGAILATVGPELVADCLCRGQPGYVPGGYPGYYQPVQQPWYQNPWMLGAAGLGAVVLVYLLLPPKKKETE